MKKKLTGKSSEDLIKKMWDSFRSNNGIMALLELLSIKTPITDADSIRALACKALVGLARSEVAKQIMSKLPIFTSSGQLQQLVREPILQDKRAEHVKFQQYAHELMEMVSTGDGGAQRLTGNSDFSLEMLHRASVVAQTKIRFSKKQLLQMIQEYVASEGLTETASVLQREANLAVMNAPNNRALIHRHNSLTTPSATPNGTPLRASQSTSNLTSPNNAGARHAPYVTPNSAAVRSLNDVTTPSGGAPSTPISVRINRTRPRNPFNSHAAGGDAANSATTPTQTPSAGALAQSFLKSAQKNCDTTPAVLPGSEMVEMVNPEERSRVSLVSIVSDYLSTQHSLCKNPMATCPEFDLFYPHKCPDPRPKNSAPMNFTTRYSRRALNPPYGGPDGFKLDRKLIYSKFRPVKTYRYESQKSYALGI